MAPLQRSRGDNPHLGLQKAVTIYQVTTLTEADTCRKHALPKLYAANWTDHQTSQQRSFTDGGIPSPENCDLCQTPLRKT